MENEIEKKDIQNQKFKSEMNALLAKIKSLWYVCVIGLLVGALFGVLYYSVLSTPKYESTSMVYLRSSNKKLSLESLQLTTSLTQDYQIIFTSRPNLESVIKELHLKYKVDELKDMITIQNPDETRILQITVRSKDADEAKNIANTLVGLGMNDIREIDSQEPFLIEKGIANTKRVGLSLVKTSLLFAFLAFALVIASIIVKFYTNDSFTSADDAEKTLGLPVLAVIAEDKSLAYAKLESSNSRRRKHHGKKTSK